MKLVGICGCVFLGIVCGCQGPPRYTSDVQYRLRGSARRAVVEFTLPDGSKERQAVTIPFRSKHYRFPIGDSPFITASNTTAYGEMWVEIFSEGELDQGIGYDPMAQHTTNAYGVAWASCLAGAR